MASSNVQSSRGVTLVGGGAPDAADIRLLMSHAPELVAADGGANACFDYGLAPVAVIGDFDSLKSETRDHLQNTRFLHVSEQDSTDFEKCLTNIEAPFILATGVTVGRLDHTLASLSALVQFQRCPVIVLSEADVIFAAPPRISLDLPTSTRVSLFPMTKITGRSKGLKWPIDGLTLSPTGRIGTSNEAHGPVELQFDRAGCLIILPREALATAMAALID